MTNEQEREAFEAWAEDGGLDVDKLSGGVYADIDVRRDWIVWRKARAALAANEKVPSRATDIATALALPGCERLREWAEIGPVQRAAVEEFAYALAAKVPADPCPGCRLGTVCRTPSCGRLKLRATPAPAPEADPCLVLWKAMNQAGKVGNRTDDKLIVKFLRDAGYRIAPAPAPEADIPSAMKAVIAAMKADPGYAWSWHCNVAMSFVDAGGDHYTANQGAARFMRLLAGVEPAHELPAPAQAQQAAELLPCPFCGHVGLDFTDGSTHRWGLASCAGCGATCGETRRAYPPDDKWRASAIKDWNTRAKPEAQQPLGEAQLEAAYREIWRNKPAHFGFTTSDWITAGIRYAERAHGIGASGEASK